MGVIYFPSDEPNLISEPGIITDMVEDRIDSVSSLVTTAYNTGINAINALAAQTFEVDWDDSVFVDVADLTSINPVKPNAPTINELTVEDVAFGGVVPDPGTVDISTDTVPDYTKPDYVFSIPTEPDVTWPVFTKEAPQATELDIPTVPSYELPAVPSLDSISVPSPPEYSIPEFDGVAPVEDLTAPAQSFNWNEDYYTSTLKDALVDKLYDGVVNGGTGLSEETEQAIYDRATSRQETEEQSMLDNISSGLAARGFDMPPGALATATLEAENKILRSREDLNNDILIQQSKLAQENTHFMLETARNLEGILIGYHSQVQSRALDSAKFVITTAIQMYSLKVEGYKAKLMAYQVLAEVYKARIQGEIAKAEFFRAQIAGVQASVQAQALMIEAYKAQVQSVAALMDVYRTQMDGARILSELDKTRIQAYLGEVQAYAEKAKAVSYQYDGYRTAVEAEKAKVDMVTADAQAYIAQVDGYRARTNVEVARAQVALQNTRMETEVFLAQIDKYKADIQRAVSEAEIQARQDGIEIESYRAESAMYTAELDGLVRSYYGKIEEAKAAATTSISNAEVGLRAMLGQYELSIEASKGIAGAAGQMAAAALSSINASIHASSSASRSDSRAESFNRNISYTGSDTDSFMVQHFYQHSD